MDDFQKDVIERSHETPVVVDFWAPWCGPCKFLSPVIEELAAAGKDLWELVKINGDEHQDLIREYKVQSIPAVKMFNKGEVIAEFTGALPKHQIENWLEENLPDEKKEYFKTLTEKLNNNPEEPLTELEVFVSENPEMENASTLLASKIVFSNHERAINLVENISIGNVQYETAEHVRIIANFLDKEFGDSNEIGQKLISAQNATSKLDFDQAVSELIKAVMIDKTFKDDLPRKAVIAFFHLLGPAHPVTQNYRRQFDMVLY